MVPRLDLALRALPRWDLARRVPPRLDPARRAFPSRYRALSDYKPHPDVRQYEGRQNRAEALLIHERRHALLSGGRMS